MAWWTRQAFGNEYADLKALVAAGFPPHVAAAASEPADYPLDRISFLPPIAAPVHIWCLALNYAEHHNEVQSAGRVQELPKSPALFARAADSLVGHGQTLLHPGVSEQFDFEGELVVVIGKPVIGSRRRRLRTYCRLYNHERRQCARLAIPHAADHAR